MNLTEYSQSIMGLHNVCVYLFVRLYVSMCVFSTSIPHDLISCNLLINLSILLSVSCSNIRIIPNGMFNFSIGRCDVVEGRKDGDLSGPPCDC